MMHGGTVGNVRVREVTLVQNTEKVFSPSGDSRALQIHSRQNKDLRIAFESTGTAGGAGASYITLQAGVYMSVPSDIQTDNIYFFSADVAGDIVEVIICDSLIGMDTAAGVNLGFKP